MQVPPLAFHLSAAAFFTNLMLSFVSFIFEDAPAKQQHAWLSCLVQCLAMRTDAALASSSALVMVERRSGAMWLPGHYEQRVVALPVLLFSVSQTSDATPLQVIALRICVPEVQPGDTQTCMLSQMQAV